MQGSPFNHEASPCQSTLPCELDEHPGTETIQQQPFLIEQSPLDTNTLSARDNTPCPSHGPPFDNEKSPRQAPSWTLCPRSLELSTCFPIDDSDAVAGALGGFELALDGLRALTRKKDSRCVTDVVAVSGIFQELIRTFPLASHTTCTIIILRLKDLLKFLESTDTAWLLHRSRNDWFKGFARLVTHMSSLAQDVQSDDEFEDQFERSLETSAAGILLELEHFKHACEMDAAIPWFGGDFDDYIKSVESILGSLLGSGSGSKSRYTVKTVAIKKVFQSLIFLWRDFSRTIKFPYDFPVMRSRLDELRIELDRTGKSHVSFDARNFEKRVKSLIGLLTERSATRSRGSTTGFILFALETLRLDILDVPEDAQVAQEASPDLEVEGCTASGSSEDLGPHGDARVGISSGKSSNISAPRE